MVICRKQSRPIFASRRKPQTVRGLEPECQGSSFQMPRSHDPNNCRPPLPEAGDRNCARPAEEIATARPPRRSHLAKARVVRRTVAPSLWPRSALRKDVTGGVDAIEPTPESGPPQAVALKRDSSGDRLEAKPTERTSGRRGCVCAMSFEERRRFPVRGAAVCGHQKTFRTARRADSWRTLRLRFNGERLLRP